MLPFCLSTCACIGRSANTGRYIGADLGRDADTRLVFMNGAGGHIATILETDARNEVGVAVP